MKIPRRLYSIADIRKYFDLEFQTLKNIWNTNEQRDVKADDGTKYHATAVMRFNINGGSYIQLKKITE